MPSTPPIEELLLAAAERQSMTFGIDRLVLEEVANAAGVTRRAAERAFPSIDHLRHAVVSRAVHQWRQEVNTRVGRGEALSEILIDVTLDQARTNLRFLSSVLPVIRSDRVLAHLVREMLESWTDRMVWEEGIPRHRADAFRMALDGFVLSAVVATRPLDEMRVRRAAESLRSILVPW